MPIGMHEQRARMLAEQIEAEDARVHALVQQCRGKEAKGKTWKVVASLKVRNLKMELYKPGHWQDIKGVWFPFSRNDPVDRRGGVVYAGEARWKNDFGPPHNGQGRQEWYAGEWLVKCIEQVKRYDEGIERMAWVEFGLGETNGRTKSEDEE